MLRLVLQPPALELATRILGFAIVLRRRLSYIQYVTGSKSVKTLKRLTNVQQSRQSSAETCGSFWQLRELNLDQNVQYAGTLVEPRASLRESGLSSCRSHAVQNFTVKRPKSLHEPPDCLRHLMLNLFRGQALRFRRLDIRSVCTCTCSCTVCKPPVLMFVCRQPGTEGICGPGVSSAFSMSTALLHSTKSSNSSLTVLSFSLTLVTPSIPTICLAGGLS